MEDFHITEAYNRGYRAYQAGQSKLCNPYDQKNNEYYCDYLDWLDGWNDANADYYDEED